MKIYIRNSIRKIGFLLLCISFGVTQNSIGQDCQNYSSTNPSNPSNSDPLLENFYNPWLNTFDFGKNNGYSLENIPLNPGAGWTDAGLSSADTVRMMNPFNIGACPNAPYMASPADSMLSRDFHWEDGWELLWLGTGFYPDGNPINQVTPNSIITSPQNVLNGNIPYMIYYNRYRGLIRVFIGVFVEFGEVQNVAVDIGLNTSIDEINPLPYNGLLRHLNEYDAPLDQPTQVVKQRGVNSMLDFNIRKWYSYDFQVGYDPCTCQNQSVIDFDVSAVQSSDVSLYGRMISLEEPLTDGNGNPIYPEDFLTATSIDAQDPNGYVLKASLNSLIGDYQQNLAAYHDQMEGFATASFLGGVLNSASGLLTNGLTFFVPADEIANWMIEKKLNWKRKRNERLLAVGNSAGIDTTAVDTAKVKNFIMDGAKGILGYGVDFLSTAITGKKPVRPIRPVATFSEMRFSGNITTTNRSSLAGFRTPGSNMQGGGITAFNYPAYNEVLGLYATLRTPEVQYWPAISATAPQFISNWVEVDSSDFENTFWPDYTRVDSTVLKSQTFNQEIYLKLKEPIQFALNKALDFDTNNTGISVSFQIELENFRDVEFSYTNNDNRIDSIKTEFSDSTNMWLMYDIPTSTTLPHPIIRKVKLVSGWSKVKDVANLLYGTLFESTVYYTELYEKDYFDGENHISFHDEFNQDKPMITEEKIGYQPVKITMKIMADMYFDQVGFDGDKINTTQIFTYLIYDKAAGVDLIAQQGNYLTDDEANNLFHGFVQMFPGILTVQSDVINHLSPEVTWPNNEINVFLVRAEQIKIDKNVEGIGGNPTAPLITFSAYENIRLLPGAHLKPKLRLKIDKDVYGVATSHPATVNELSQFCNSNNYHANILAPALQGRLDKIAEHNDTAVKEKQPKQRNQISLHPNPAKEYIWITSSARPITEVEIFDLSGRRLIHENIGDELQRVRLDIHALQSGVYGVQIHYGVGRGMQKLVVGK